MAKKIESRTKTPTKRAAKPAPKTPKPNGAADPTASLESLTAVVDVRLTALAADGSEQEIFAGQGRHAGLEIGGEIEEIL